ncbi:MAG: spermidine/putrescine ABC transporter substrate-binding protein [Candidatus Fournierella pullistercoris]|uniref:Spermidine/putrescine ABC transporter substrate-binding protein n=1 Tax=Candidatus Allofournierella pullistercoris TaxID=2838597 RepID=A0A948T362_9FIRM|nr:spermidine/putrescine ABC transporter substrate-binding protein [Candidatus Fournierella pullistercoris]
MKRLTCLLLSLLLAVGAAALPVAAEEDTIVINEDISVSANYDWTRFKDKGVKLNVYNWGLYISDGSDESVNVVEAFEQLTGIDVNYTTYDTNESLYAKMKGGGANYDIIVPSDYMIGKMIAEDMLAPLDYSNIPNAQMIGEQYRHQSYDPQDAYSVPYTWGVVGIVYNKTMVEEEPDSWNVMWDERYTNSILMFNNSRDAFAIAARKLGMSMNPKIVEEVNIIAEELKKQKLLVQAYVMDEIFDKMGGGEAALAPYYAGDALVMMEENEDLGFVIPKEGTNFFVDALCIPKTSQNKEAAEMFINFLCEPDVGLANCEFIGYSTPLDSVREMLPEELANNPIAYPSAEVLANTEAFTVLPDEINAAMDAAWSDMKSYDEEGGGWVVPVFLILALAMTCFNVWRRRRRKKRREMY